MTIINARRHRVHTVRHICRVRDATRAAVVLSARHIDDSVDDMRKALIEIARVMGPDFLRSSRSTSRKASPRQGRAEPVPRARPVRSIAPETKAMHTRIQRRAVVSLLISTVVGAAERHQSVFASDQLVGAALRLERSVVHDACADMDAAVWFSSAFVGASLGLSIVYIFVTRDCRGSDLPLAAYPSPEQHTELFVALGEQHQRTPLGRAPAATWLTIVERGLFIGPLVVGAVGSGKTSACLDPSVEQQLATRADHRPRQAAGLIVDAKKHVCRQVRGILTRHGHAR